MSKVYFGINFMVGLLGVVLAFALWTVFASSPRTVMSYIYLALLCGPEAAFTFFSFSGLFGKSSLKTIEICRAAVFAGLVIAALLSRFMTS